ncbi:MAG: class I SAM-dependent methyltransferase [Rubrimonas sp.]|uniref:cyclopropane-fatty-acyl-phospholipid synthase family protein n=1 Tax=Rubrimonas sp. TaxID=2036015 RepID=UPI002FDDB24C
MRFLPKLLARAVRKGRLTVTGPQGERHEFGDGDGPSAAIRISDPAFDWRIFLNPELNAAEAFMDGALTMEEGSVANLLEVFYVNKRAFDLTPSQIFWRTLARRGRRFLTDNTLARASRNARAHYDIGEDLYARMLDRDMQYSCAYWSEGVETLEEAQTAKKRRIAAKLALSPGMRVLDIGCGWGGMALYLAAICEARVVGVTLSPAQLQVAQARAQAAGLADRVEFRLCDYRAVAERFDRVVSVGMLEHVGVGRLPEYFLTVRDRLGPGGVALIHSISTKSPPGVTGPFIRKHIFPGGYAPSMSEMLAAVETTGLWTLDVEIWRVHYADTLRVWRENFLATAHALPPAYDDRFKRMWEFYLAASEGAFRHGSSCVAQLQLGRERDAVPLRRGYVGETEKSLAARETGRLEPLLASTQAALAEIGAQG